MLKDFVNSIKGKITVVIFFLIILEVFFAGFVFIQNKTIEKKTKLLNLHAEPAVTLTFITTFSLASARVEFLKNVINKDTSKAAFLNSYNDFTKSFNTIKLHCDTLELPENNAFKVAEASFEKYLVNYNKVIEIIYDYRFNKKYTDIEIDSILKLKLDELENPAYWEAFGNVFGYLQSYIGLKDDLMSQLLDITSRIVWVIFFLTAFIIIISVSMWNHIFRYVGVSINFIINHLKKVSIGELIIEKTEKKDEIAQILTASNRLVSNLNFASDFAISVGKGEFKNNFKPASEKDVLGLSLITMRDELRKFKTEDEKRFWTNKGLAKFADVMRENNQNISTLSDVFLSELVKYLDASQGAIYFAQKNNSEKVQLQMIACYAYDKKKHEESIIEEGEGIVGQIYKEKETIYLKEIPENYIKITSGLGEALPTTLLIVPIKIENEVLGVLELANFDEFEKHKIDFTEIICSNLASVLQTVANAEKMNELLNELRNKSEQMHSQEEELRQNMEELMATQEELQRKDAEREKLIESLKQEIENLKSKN